jgi:glycine oxidase
MAGPAPDGAGLFLALAPRRNGWLLAPMVGAVVADAIEGRAPSPAARALDPRRF